MKSETSIYTKVTRPLLLGFVLHFGMCLAISKVRNEDPQSNLHVTTSSRAIILYGKNSWGFSTVKLFDQWSDFANYMTQKNLSLPMISAANLPQAFQIELMALNPEESMLSNSNIQMHKVLWKTDSGPTKVILTPDITTAQIFKEYAFYVGIQPGSLGFSLPLEKN